MMARSARSVDDQASVWSRSLSEMLHHSNQHRELAGDAFRIALVAAGAYGVSYAYENSRPNMKTIGHQLETSP
jgi:hypothetical protein